MKRKANHKKRVRQSRIRTSPEKKENLTDLRLLEILIKKVAKKLEKNSCRVKIEDALKAIQLRHKLTKAKSKELDEASEANKIFWEEIEEIRRTELPKLYPEPVPSKNLESQMVKIIIELKEQVRNGVLPVKTITDTFNRGKSKPSQLTYQRVGRLLSLLGFTKATTDNGSSAIIWDDKLIPHESISRDTELVPQDDSKKIKQTSETPEATNCSHLFSQ